MHPTDDTDLLPTGAKVRRRDDWSRRGIVVENAESRNVIVAKGKVVVFWTSGNQIQTHEYVKDLEAYG